MKLITFIERPDESEDLIEELTREECFDHVVRREDGAVEVWCACDVDNFEIQP